MTATLISESDRRVEKGTHEMSIVIAGKAARITWDPMNPQEVEDARNMFNSAMTDTGSLAFDVKDNPNDSEVIKKFDPETEHIVVSSPLVGG